MAVVNGKIVRRWFTHLALVQAVAPPLWVSWSWGFPLL